MTHNNYGVDEGGEREWVGMRVGQRKWSEQRNEGGTEGVGHLFLPTAVIV